MKLNKRNQLLRFKNRLYVNLLVFLGMISLSLLWGCGNNSNEQKNQQRIDDSIAAAKHKQDSTAKAGEDSIASAMIGKSKHDSIAKADSIKKAREMQTINRPKYGVPVNYRPNDGAKKYGVDRPVDD